MLLSLMDDCQRKSFAWESACAAPERPANSRRGEGNSGRVAASLSLHVYAGSRKRRHNVYVASFWELLLVVSLFVRSFSRTPTREPIGKVARDKERGKELQRSPKNSETRRRENFRVFAGKLVGGNSATKMVKNTVNVQKCHEN